MTKPKTVTEFLDEVTDRYLLDYDTTPQRVLAKIDDLKNLIALARHSPRFSKALEEQHMVDECDCALCVEYRDCKKTIDKITKEVE